jgi:hypothetical protein
VFEGRGLAVEDGGEAKEECGAWHVATAHTGFHFSGSV